MSQLRLNPLTDRWVAVAVERASRPGDFAPRSLPFADEQRPCPFCPGHEEETPPALETYARDGRPPSAVSLVSAPSRTSDIEKISTLGAHGAKGLHLLVIADR